jgi:hypothetical protein
MPTVGNRPKPGPRPGSDRGRFVTAPTPTRRTRGRECRARPIGDGSRRWVSRDYFSGGIVRQLWRPGHDHCDSLQAALVPLKGDLFGHPGQERRTPGWPLWEQARDQALERLDPPRSRHRLRGVQPHSCANLSASAAARSWGVGDQRILGQKRSVTFMTAAWDRCRSVAGSCRKRR